MQILQQHSFRLPLQPKSRGRQPRTLDHIRRERRLARAQLALASLAEVLPRAVGETLLRALKLSLKLAGLMLLVGAFWWTAGMGARGDTLPRSLDASQAVVDFHRAVDSGAYQVAYAMLSPEWRAEISLADFEKGYGGARLIGFTVVDAQVVQSGRAEVVCRFVLSDQGESRDYRGRYQLKHDGERWLLDSGAARSDSF